MTKINSRKLPTAYRKLPSDDVINLLQLSKDNNHFFYYDQLFKENYVILLLKGSKDINPIKISHHLSAQQKFNSVNFLSPSFFFGFF